LSSVKNRMDSAMLDQIAKFLFEVGMLKKTPRTGYQFLGSGRESVAAHSFRTVVIGYVLASRTPGVDLSRVIQLCLFHDLPEARTGDHNYVNKRYVTVDEVRALQDQVGGLPFGADILSLFNEFNEGATIEARLAKDADQLDLILELKAYKDLGNPHAEDWLSFALQRLSTDEARALAHVVLETDWTDWWFDKQTDWWVNGPNGRRDVE